MLNWDFSPIYAIEREAKPELRFRWRGHRRVRFAHDAEHPTCASHHQKVVVIDERLAFTGGIDLTLRRWDTSEHRPQEPGRVDRDGEPYPPFHDVQILIEGEAAEILAALARERWLRATGKPLQRPKHSGASAWPECVRADLERVSLAIARTEPEYPGSDEPGVSEVVEAYEVAIASAQKCIYAETQYLTSRRLEEALSKRLREPDGPEIVLVAPTHTDGWMEQGTMGILTARLVQRLKAADTHGRFRVYTPWTDETAIFVHAKVLLVDDRLLRIGSSNMSNRSMGVDTECDAWIESTAPRTSEVIRGFRERLLGEHLGVEPAAVGRAFEETGSLIQAIEQLRGGARTLNPLEPGPSDVTPLVPLETADPETPLDAEALLRGVVPFERQRAMRRSMLRVAFMLAGLLALALLWRLEPLRAWLDPAWFSTQLALLRDNPWTAVAVVPVYVTLTNLMVPVNLLILATGVIFGPVMGALYAFVGALCGAATGQILGHRLGRAVLQRGFGQRAERVRRMLGRRGLVAFTFVRFIPVASFGLVNLCAGAMRVPFKEFMLGTAIGLLPGVIVLPLFADTISALFVRTDSVHLALAVASGGGAIIALILLSLFVGRRVEARSAAMANLPGREAESKETAR